MKPSEKLFKRLKKELNLNFSENAKIRVLHSSKWQKSRGTLSFVITESLNGAQYGSGEKISDLLNAKELELYDRGFGFYIEILGK